MIVNRSDIEPRQIEIDLAGPEGNAFVLLGMAENFAKQLGYDELETSDLLKDMQSADYNHLVNVFENAFGSFVTLIY
jgi:hypothetical protein